MKAARGRQGGFALLEVLIAFAIAAMALGLLFQAASSSGGAAKQAGNYEEAVSRAKSRIAAVGRDSDIAPGENGGDDGGAYRWRVKISPSAVAQAPGDGPPVTTHLTLYDVEVAISWTDSGHKREVVLHSQRLAGQQGTPNG
jgi:general secretion pathway protein I